MMSGHQPRPAHGEAAELLLDLAETVSSGLGLTATLQAVTDVGTVISGADLGAFFSDTGEGDGSCRLHVTSGGEPARLADLPDSWTVAPVGPSPSRVDMVRVDDLSQDHRADALLPSALPMRSCLTAPVVAADGEILGVLLFGHTEPAAFDDGAERLVHRVATQAAAAIRSARLLDAEKAARLRVEKMTAGLALLQLVTARLATAERTEDVLDIIVKAIVEPLAADRLGVYTPDSAGRLRRLPTAGHQLPAGTAYYELVPDFRSLGRRAFEEARTVWASSRAELEEGYPELAADVPAVRALIALPLMVAGACQGSMVLSWTRDRDFEIDEIRVFEAVAGQLAATIERVRAAEAEARAQAELHQHVAELTQASTTLQRSLLPRSLPTIDGLSYAVRYLPGTAGAEVGGDWYDVVTSPDGVVTLVVGDVEGHSFSAAAVMGTVSTALRAYLLEGHAPEVALARVNPIVEQSGVIATCCLVSLDLENGRVSLVRAGHPYPVYRLADGTTLEAQVEGGPPLGVTDAGVWPVTSGWASEHDRLLLYTDGLVERTDEDVDLQLLEVVAGATGSVEDIADLVVGSLPGTAHDDVAVLVAEFTGMVRQVSAQINVKSQREVSLARRFARDTLDVWQLGELEEAVTLVVSEMVTNAVLHADGTALLEMRPERGGVRICVTDTTALTPRPRHADDDDVNGRGLLLVETLAQAWGVEPAAEGKTVWARVVDADALPEPIAT